jgi:hypothetical protein
MEVKLLIRQQVPEIAQVRHTEPTAINQQPAAAAPSLVSDTPDYGQAMPHTRFA